MALTFEWKLTGLTKSTPSQLGLENVIIGTRWQVTGTDEDGNTGTFSGATPLSLDSIDPDNFVPYENLTEPLILEWIESIVGENSPTGYWGHILERIEEQIAQVRDQITSVDGDFPWAPAPTIAGETVSEEPVSDEEETPISGSEE